VIVIPGSKATRESEENEYTMKNFFAYKIFCQPFDPDMISGVMWDFDITGLLEDDDHITIFISENSSTTEVQINNALNKLKQEMLIESFSIKKELLEDKNWNELWEKSREVIRVSDRIVIKPTFKDYSAKANEIVLTIDPKMSFGTGEHQTTKLILRLLEKYVKRGMKVLDVGSGTGILAIASVKLGAKRAIAVDFDEICMENCKENCFLNGVENSVEVLAGEIHYVKENEFDLILANIQKNVLLEIAKEIKIKSRKNGIVILSGLLKEDEESIIRNYTLVGFQFTEKLILDEWIALLFQN
jgi:ribosomal protein L11 methyltransferase